MDHQHPTPDNPLLIGILVDVSASMLEAIHNRNAVTQNRLEAFQSSLAQIASTASSSGIATSNGSIRAFAYGFGFGNIASIFFGSSPPVVDLLEGAASDSTVCMTNLAKDWHHYQAHVQSLATKMFGSTPMLAGFQEAHRRFRREIERLDPSLSVLFVLSDGEPTDDDGEFSGIHEEARKLRDEGVLVISCYVTSGDIAEMRRLYSSPPNGWPSGAKLMCDVASTIPSELGFQNHLDEHNWSYPEDARLFCQVNQSELMTEFMELVISPFGEGSGNAFEEVENSHTPSIFVSYSHKDTKWLDRVCVHLKPLVRDGRISVWSDKAIEPGQSWSEEIDSALEDASAAVLLVSADFLASDFIHSVELPALLKRAKDEGVRIYPLILSPCRFSESELSSVQAAHNPGDTLEQVPPTAAEEVFVHLSRTIEAHLTKG